MRNNIESDNKSKKTRHQGSDFVLTGGGFLDLYEQRMARCVMITGDYIGYGYSCTAETHKG